MAIRLAKEGRHPVKAIVRTLGVSRSNLLEQLRGRPPRAPAEQSARTAESAENEAILLRVRELVNQRASYGYRRITALLNRQRTAAGEPRVNPKRIYRLMKSEHMLLERCTGDRPGRKHDGVIVTLKPNLRWCSDSFEIRCWSGERVHVAFALDCCDREIVGLVAAPGPLCGEHIRDMMVQAIESRFGAGTRRIPMSIEWLSDNGSIYTSDETRAFGAEIGFAMCTTPPYSPESNGMAESLVKSLKRDYVYLADLLTAADVLAQLPEWVDDYNRVRPHKGLKMLSPIEFRNQQLAS
jgi:transposase InsO family protein